MYNLQQNINIVLQILLKKLKMLCFKLI